MRTEGRGFESGLMLLARARALRTSPLGRFPLRLLSAGRARNGAPRTKGGGAVGGFPAKRARSGRAAIQGPGGGSPAKGKQRSARAATVAAPPPIAHPSPGDRRNRRNSIATGRTGRAPSHTPRTGQPPTSAGRLPRGRAGSHWAERHWAGRHSRCLPMRLVPPGRPGNASSCDGPRPS